MIKKSYDSKRADYFRPVRRLLKRGCEFKGFTKGGANFEAKIRGVNSVSSENLHAFEIICPAREVRTHPRTPLRTGLYLKSNHSKLSSRDTNDHLFVRSQLLSLTYLEFFVVIVVVFKIIYNQTFYLV